MYVVSPFRIQIYSSRHLQICFCDESYREQFYKVGSEAIAQLMEKRPNCLEVLISVLDRQMSHMDNVCFEKFNRHLFNLMHFQYAVDVLSTCSLSACRISSPILSVLGKWLITHVGTFIPHVHTCNFF